MQNNHRIQINCKKCHKSYSADISSLEPGRQVKIDCNECGQEIRFRVPKNKEVQTADFDEFDIPDAQGGDSSKKKYLFGLTPKFMMFVLLPLVAISAASIVFSIGKMLEFQNLTVKESSDVVMGVSESLIRQISQTVSRQARQYLYTNPDLQKDRFNNDIYFKKVAIQHFGITGHTALYEQGSEKGAWRYWAHQDPRLVGKDMAEMKRTLGNSFADFWKVMSGVDQGKVTSGIFKWPDDTGRMQDTFMVCTPVEGTPYAVSASIFLIEITKPLKEIEAKGIVLSKSMRNTNIAILGIGLLVIGVIIYFYGSRLTGKIKQLAQTADSISMGDLDRGVQVHSKDEIGELGDAISRMQTSLKISLSHLG